MSATIRKFHEKYFEIIEDYFGIHYEKMRREGQTIPKATREALRPYNKTLAASVCDTLFDELNRLEWNSIENYLRQHRGIKALFEAPIGSLFSQNLFRRVSLYADTIVFSGTLLQSRKERFMSLKPVSRIWHVIGSSLALLEMKNLFLADVTPPIVTLASPPAFSNPETVESWKELYQRDGLGLCSDVFGKRFSSTTEIHKFILKQKTLDDLCKKIKSAEFFASYGSSFRQEVELMMRTVYAVMPDYYIGFKDPDLLVDAILNLMLGMMGLANSQLISCGSLRAELVADRQRAWRFLTWKLDHDNRFLAEKLKLEGFPRDSLVLNTLQLDSFKWLGDVPFDGIVRMREEGELQNLRDILRNGVKEIETVNDEDFLEVTRQVSYNLNQAFKRHGAQVKRLDEKYRRKYSIDATTLVVGGSIGMVSALFPPLAMVVGILGGVIGGGGIMQIVRHIEEERIERIELQRKPIGLLFRAYQDSEKPKT